MTFPGAGRPFFVSGGFDPTIYPGFTADWIADNAVEAAGFVISVPPTSGAVGALDPLGSTPAWQATGWPDGSPSIGFDNVTAMILESSTGFSGASDLTHFIVFEPDSNVPTVDVQYLFFSGLWGDGTLFGMNFQRSFTPEASAYRQGLGFFADFVDLGVAGPQVWSISYRAADSPQQVEIRRNGVLMGSGDCAAPASTAVAICGLEIGGGIIGPGFSLNGRWKRSLHYEGSGLTASQIADINASLVSLYV